MLFQQKSLAAFCFVTRNVAFCRQSRFSSSKASGSKNRGSISCPWPSKYSSDKNAPSPFTIFQQSKSRWIDEAVWSGLVLLLVAGCAFYVAKRRGHRLNAQKRDEMAGISLRDFDHEPVYDNHQTPFTAIEMPTGADASALQTHAADVLSRPNPLDRKGGRMLFVARRPVLDRLRPNSVPSAIAFEHGDVNVAFGTDNNLCSVCFTETAVDGLACSGSHAFCSDCFINHARTAFESGGSFERLLVVESITSQEGELPCPFFARDGCSCAAFPSKILRTFINDEEVANLWMHAIGRVAVAKNIAEVKITALARQRATRNRTDVELLCHAVNEILNLGRYVACPNCQSQGEKDDACIHISCVFCDVDWCYVCGRHRMRGIDNRCRSCDVGGFFIESHDGYQFNVSGETRGESALHEFHRRRMLYFLRQLQESVPKNLWRAMKRANPNIFDDVPTPGRRILFHEISTAKIPLFGTTKESRVAWRKDAQPIIQRLLQQLNA